MHISFPLYTLFSIGKPNNTSRQVYDAVASTTVCRMTVNDNTENTSSNKWSNSNSDTEEARKLTIWPLDEYNIQLLDAVHPKDYVSPKAILDADAETSTYDLVVIGSGAGGLVTSKQAARRGVPRVALISEELAGGDCLNVGCVPSKALIRSAKSIREVRRCADFGVRLTTSADGSADVQVSADFERIMARMRKLRATIAPVDSHEATEEAGAAVFQGRGVFTSPTTISVNGQTTLEFNTCVVATGGRATLPSIKGLKEAPYTTNADLFNLTTLPKKMVIIGSGVVALEMAQTFATFGSDVTVLNRSPRLFPRGDEDVARLIEAALVSDGVTFFHGVQYDAVKTISTANPVSMVVIGKNGDGQEMELECDLLLVAAGRTPNTSDLGLEDAGVEYDRGGIIVDDLLRCSNPNILAVGDCVSGVPRLTHMAGEMAKVAVQNGIFNDSWKLSSLVVPATMYTEPEYASVGRIDTGDDVDVYMASIEHNDRSILESEEHPGFVKILCAKGTDKIVGAMIVSSRAGEMINEIVLAMSQGIGLMGIGRCIHSYPTLGESVMGVGLSYIRSQWKFLTN